MLRIASEPRREFANSHTKRTQFHTNDYTRELTKSYPDPIRISRSGRFGASRFNRLVVSDRSKQDDRNDEGDSDVFDRTTKQRRLTAGLDRPVVAQRRDSP